jgi:hypothetical protein
MAARGESVPMLPNSLPPRPGYSGGASRGRAG